MDYYQQESSSRIIKKQKLKSEISKAHQNTDGGGWAESKDHADFSMQIKRMDYAVPTAIIWVPPSPSTT